MSVKKIESLEDICFLLNDQISAMNNVGSLSSLPPQQQVVRLLQNQTVVMTALLIIAKEMGLEKRNKLSIAKEMPK